MIALDVMMESALVKDGCVMVIMTALMGKMRLAALLVILEELDVIVYST